ncbi:AAA family ATPase [Candidatus Tisiphia endosymbiont of Thecophora atra]|uniref:AAA family ATPase n=1 Tax=Candidatus Tisiphia endosymbiont of Thecophora atra TaxID=3066258 RepID=UPI00312CB74A
MAIPFIGRQQELQTLSKLLKKNVASLVVIQGRRRIGKSRLVEEFARDYTFYQFAGLPPTQETTAQSERNEFSQQLAIQTRLPELYADDWSKLFILLAEKIKTGRIIVLFDEISWMGSKDPDFLGKLKNAWDLYFKKNPKLMLVLCGSASVWIEKNILSNTGFVGRISYRLTLDELPLQDCNKFWLKMGHYISAYEKFKVLSVSGGIPRYLEEIKPELPAEDNIRDLCFIKGGLLVNEFNDIFSDLFSIRSSTYKKIIQALSNSPQEIKSICNMLNIAQTGFISEYLDDLVKSGFVSRDYTWHIASGEISKLSYFRLSDNYLRFYLKYIDKNRLRIENNEFAFKALTSFPGWEGIMGLQFENLVLKNRNYIKKCLHISLEEVISDNPFFQKQTTRYPSCQIDYLIQTKFGGLYVCEVKFSKYLITSDIINEVQKKLDSLYYPKGFSCRPVLVHVNGVHEDVIDSGFFAAIIDFGSLLKE